MRPIGSFNGAIKRSQHLLHLYTLLQDTRQRSVRADWAENFNRLMHWPASEKIVRVDGKGRNSVLILRDRVGIDRDQFAHDYLCELLRSAVVAAVSAMDKYLHDIIVDKAWKLLDQGEENVPKELRKVNIPITTAKKALKHLKINPTARPGTIVKSAIQEQLHQTTTFQNPSSVLQAGKMLGIGDFWGKVSNELPGNQSKNDVIGTLQKITHRRNQIVHEADQIRRTRAHKITLRDLSFNQAEKWVIWIEAFIKSIDSVVDRAI